MEQALSRVLYRGSPSDFGPVRFTSVPLITMPEMQTKAVLVVTGLLSLAFATGAAEQTPAPAPANPARQLRAYRDRKSVV